MKYVAETPAEHFKVWCIESYGTQGRAAEALGMSFSMVSAMANGHKNLSARALEAMGWEKVVIYRPKGEAHRG